MFRKLATALVATLVIGGSVLSTTSSAEAGGSVFIPRHGGGWGHGGGGWGHGGGGWGHGGGGWGRGGGWGHRGGWGWGGAAAAGFVGGALLGSALAAPGYGYYDGPDYYAPGPAYYGPACYWRRQRFFDGYYWRVRRVEVCD